MQEFRALVNATPTLSDNFARLQRQLEASLAQAIAEAAALPADDVAAASLARYALEGVVLANAALDPHAALESIFERLRRGWSDLP